jgi:hypothetical protein
MIRTRIVSLFLVLAMFGIVAVIAARDRTPAAVGFTPFAPQTLMGTFTWLFAIAVFLERAVEVIVMVLRDREAEALQAAVDAEQQRLDEAAKAAPTAPLNLDALHQAQKPLADFRAETRQIALCISFVLGTAVSLAGVRAFATIMTPAPPGNWLFPTIDVLVTGAVVAGGSEGVHQIVNVFSNFLSSMAEKAKG